MVLADKPSELDRKTHAHIIKCNKCKHRANSSAMQCVLCLQRVRFCKCNSNSNQRKQTTLHMFQKRKEYTHDEKEEKEATKEKEKSLLTLRA